MLSNWGVIGVRFQLFDCQVTLELPAKNQGQIPIISSVKNLTSSRPPWGLIFLLFRSKNGPHAVRLYRDISEN